MNRRIGLLLPFGVLSLAVVGAGIFISASNGVPAGVWARNGIAWIAGALAAAGLSALKRRDVLQVALWAAPVGLAASLLSPGVQDVHRWVNLGPLQLNVAMLLAPAAVVALAVLCRAGASAWVAGLAALVLLVIQPDASQATTLAAVAVLVALAAFPRAPVRIAVVGVAAALAGMAWPGSVPIRSNPWQRLRGYSARLWRCPHGSQRRPAFCWPALRVCPSCGDFAGLRPSDWRALRLGCVFCFGR